MESGGILVHENWRNVTLVPLGFQSSRFKQTLGFFLLRWMATRSDVCREFRRRRRSYGGFLLRHRFGFPATFMAAVHKLVRLDLFQAEHDYLPRFCRNTALLLNAPPARTRYPRSSLKSAAWLSR